MEIEPVSFSSTTSAKDRWLDLWAQKLQATQRSHAASADATTSGDDANEDVEGPGGSADGQH